MGVAEMLLSHKTGLIIEPLSGWTDLNSRDQAETQ